MPGDIVVESLIKFATPQQIRAWWQTCLEAHVANSTEAVTITGLSLGGSSSSGIAISPSARERFMRQCQAALADLEDDEQSSGGYGTHIYFSHRRLET